MNATLLPQYRKDGFVIVPRLFSEDELQRVLGEAKEVFLKQIRRHPISSSLPFHEKVYALFQKDHAAFLGAARLCQHLVSLHQLCLHPTVLNTLQDLDLTHPTLCMKPLLFFHAPQLAKQESHHRTPVHQDWRSMQGSLDAVVIWVPLVDVDLPLGAIQAIPGSHRNGLLPSEKDAWYRQVRPDQYRKDDFVSIPVKAGDALIFSAFLIHRSGLNRSGKIRWSMQFRYNNMDETTFIDRYYANPYTIYHPQQDLITPNFPQAGQVETLFVEPPSPKGKGFLFQCSL